MRLHIGDKEVSTWSMRPWLLLKELGVPFEVEEHRFLDDVSLQRQQWRAFSPTSKVPVLENGEIVSWDSLAICLYLAERFSGIWPQDPAARAWSYSAVAEMHSGFTALRTQCPFPVRAEKRGMTNADLVKDVQRIEELWQQGLAQFGGGFLAGDTFSVADAFYAPVVLRLDFYGLIGAISASSQAYMARICNLAGVKEWCARN